MADDAETPLAVRLNEALGDAFTIEGEIGRGGMGVVYRARDERLKRRVAIKVLPPELAFQADIRARFTREAQTAARLSHPHVVPIYTVGEGNKLVYFIMGYVDGESLAGRIQRRGSLPVEEVRRIMKETADALSAAHALAIIHRDIKPDNILLEGTRGRVMVTDFGIAKALSSVSGATLTSAGVAIGTPSYMSPEQAAGEKEIDGRADIYSLGVVAYQMTTGELPFTAPTVAGILMKQITEPAPMVGNKRADVPEDLSLAIARCLEKDPENRWPTADALRRALESRMVSGYRPTGQTRRGGTGARPSHPAAHRAPAVAGFVRPGLPGACRAAGSALAPDPPPELRRTAAPAPPGRPTRRRCPTPVNRRSSSGCAAGSPPGRRPPAASFSSTSQPGSTRPGSCSRPGGWGSASCGTTPSSGRRDTAGGTCSTGRRPMIPSTSRCRRVRASFPVSSRSRGWESTARTWCDIRQAINDRAAILKLVERMSPAERQMLPDDVVQTTDALFERASELARTLHAMDTNMDTREISNIDDRIAAILREPEDEERARRLGLLESKKRKMQDLINRREQVERHMDSCILAMQNVRFDLLRLRSADAGSALGDLTNATQQARALSRDVDVALAAASEIREALS